MNTFNDDNELGFFDEPRRRPPRGRERRPERSGPRRSGPPAGTNGVLRLAGLVALGIAIVFGFVLACSGQSKADYSSYIDAMRPLAHDSAAVGTEFTKALGTSSLTMETFQADLATWSQQEKTDYLKAQRLQPPGPLQSVHAAALATFQLRYTSLDHLASTLTRAQAAHDSASVAAAALAGDAGLLSASDTDWEQLFKLQATQILTDHGVTGVIVPGSTIVTNPDIVSTHGLRILYELLGPSSGGNLKGVHGSNLIGTSAVESGVTTPLSTSAETTLAAGPGSNLVIDVLFNNSGSYAEVHVVVDLTVTAGKNKYTTKQTVAQVGIGEQATASFSNLALPSWAFGASAKISVNIERVPGEARLDNNQATYPVLFNLASH